MMNHQYIIMKRTNSWDWDEPSVEHICIAINEEEAKEIVSWLEENDERYDEENISYEYWYDKTLTVDNLESFVKMYDN